MAYTTNKISELYSHPSLRPLVTGPAIVRASSLMKIAMHASLWPYPSWGGGSSNRSGMQHPLLTGRWPESLSKPMLTKNERSELHRRYVELWTAWSDYAMALAKEQSGASISLSARLAELDLAFEQFITKELS